MPIYRGDNKLNLPDVANAYRGDDQVYSSGVTVFNTYIGGVGGVLTTPALLVAQFTGIGEGAINDFTIIGDNIACNIYQSHRLITGAFRVGAATWTHGDILTHFIGGPAMTNVTTLYAFYDQSHCKAVLMKYVTSFTTRSYYNTFMDYVYNPVTVNFGTQSSCFMIRNNLNCKRVYLPLCTRLGSTQTTSPFTDRTFNNMSTELLNIYVNPVLMTNNAGGIDADLVLANSNYGCKITSVTDFTPPENITDLTGNNLGSALVKNKANDWLNSGAESSQSISGDGYVETTIASIIDNRWMFGLSYNSPDDDFTTIDYAMYNRTPFNDVGIYENGSGTILPVSINIGDVFRVERVGTAILYKINGITVYTSPITATLSPMIADISIYEKGGSISEAIIDGVPINWININGAEFGSIYQFNFTPPTSLNALDFYEVWVDDGDNDPAQLFYPHGEISGDGGEIAIPINTLKVKIAACDEFWNGSGMSETPAFSNEINI